MLTLSLTSLEIPTEGSNGKETNLQLAQSLTHLAAVVALWNEYRAVGNIWKPNIRNMPGKFITLIILHTLISIQLLTRKTIKQ